MVKTKTEYDETLIQINEPLYLMRKLKNMQKGIETIQKQIDAYTTLIPKHEFALIPEGILCRVNGKMPRTEFTGVQTI